MLHHQRQLHCPSAPHDLHRMICTTSSALQCCSIAQISAHILAFDVSWDSHIACKSLSNPFAQWISSSMICVDLLFDRKVLIVSFAKWRIFSVTSVGLHLDHKIIDICAVALVSRDKCGSELWSQDCGTAQCTYCVSDCLCALQISH